MPCSKADIDKLNMFYRLRKSRLFGPVFSGMLAVYLLIMPITAWNSFSDFMPASLALIDLSKIDATVSMADCHQQATLAGQQNPGVDCCNGSDASPDCADCPDNCQSTAHSSIASNNACQWARGREVLRGMPFIISSAGMAAPFRPPISVLS